MRAMTLLLLVLCLALAGACSDDSTPNPEAGVKDGPLPGYEGTGPFPDIPLQKDSAAWKCTAGAANMCDGDKNKYCKSGVCTQCPSTRVDCDRTGDCECIGACNGTKCVM